MPCKRTFALLVIALLAMPPVSIAQGPSSSGLEAIQTLISDSMSGNCPKNPTPVSEERALRFLQRLDSEELSLGEAHELARIGLNFECLLSEDARPAAIALKKEAATRRLDPVAVMKQEVELVTPTLLPESWSALLAESGHSSELQVASGLKVSEKVDPILLGCVAVVTYVASSWTCSNDAFEEYEDCLFGRLCEANEVLDDNCCEEKLDDDLLNCYFSGGTNGPDGDYGNCCQ